MTKKEMKAFYEAKTLGEVRGIYVERDRVLNNMYAMVKDHAKKITELSLETKGYTVNRLKDHADHIKSLSKDIAEDTEFLNFLKPILDKKESEGIDQAEYERYMADNKENIQLLIYKVDEMKKNAFENWDNEKWSRKDIIYTHDFMLKELIIMLKDTVGTIEEITRLEYNPNRGMDGSIRGTKGAVQINTILASGMIQKLHYRTLIHRY